MRIIVEVIIAFLAAGGLLALGWFVLGRLLAPIGGKDGGKIFAVVPAHGAGETLEHDIAGLTWLRAGGMANFRIAIADNGLDEQGLEIAAALLRKEPELLFFPAGELAEYIRHS